MGRWDDEDDEVLVEGLSNEFGPFRRAKTVRVERQVEPDLGASVTHAGLKAVEEEVRDALRIVMSLPGDRLLFGLRGGKSCLASIVVCELDTERRVIPKSAKEITRSQNLIDLLLDLDDVDGFAIKVVLFRAMPKPVSWDKISQEDPRGRGRRQLYNLQREALAALWIALRKKNLCV